MTMTTKKVEKLIETKQALAKKYANLAKISGSKPRQKKLLNQSNKYVRQVQRLAGK
jgi:hypothetical protein